MPHLVALDLPGGPAFVDALRRLWDRDDAVLPVDQRLPGPARAALFTALRPGRIVDADGERVLEGDPVEPGDALVMPTSGSTGAPKGVVHTMAGLEASARAGNAWLGVEAVDHWLACLPLAHIGGFTVITKALAAGTRRRHPRVARAHHPGSHRPVALPCCAARRQPPTARSTGQRGGHLRPHRDR
jgi:O-succinylbenzoic acid--CoA ligase